MHCQLCFLLFETVCASLLGQLIGVALRTGLPIPISLAPIVWKRLVGEKRGLDDLKHVDQFYFQVKKPRPVPRMVGMNHWTALPVFATSSILQNSRIAVTLLLMFIAVITFAAPLHSSA